MNLYSDSIDLSKIRSAHIPLAASQTECIADGNTAAAYACLQMWRAVLFPGFPITPSTKWIETIASVIGNQKGGIKKIKLLEAEHAVADYMAGAGAACRDLIVSTATSSVGLDHMTESVKSLGASGLGNLLLVNVYRATANYPLCIEGDPSDTLAHRDDGWIQISCRGVQQIYDTLIQAPVLGMHPEILTPVMPGFYGIKDSHRSARLTMEADSQIHQFQDASIRDCALPGLINGDTAMGNCVTSKFFQGFKIGQRARMEKVFQVLPEIGKSFEKKFGRPGLEFVEPIRWPAEDAVDLAVVGMGPDLGTAAALLPALEKTLGSRLGILGVRLLTPFPADEYRRRLRHAKAVLVVNQAHHYGAGHLSLDVTQACYSLHPRPVIVSCFAGMGGADLSEATWEAMLTHAKAAMDKGEKVVPPAVVHEGKILWQS